MRRYRRLSGEGLMFGIPMGSIQAFLEARGFTQCRTPIMSRWRRRTTAATARVGWLMGTPLSRQSSGHEDRE